MSDSSAILAGRCSYGLWTRTASNVVHLDGPSTRVYTLGQFCDIWSRTAHVDATFVNRLRATPANAIHVYVAGKGVSADYRDVILTDREQVTIEIGAPLRPPASRVDGALGNDL